jgi:hypothetical protein
MEELGLAKRFVTCPENSTTVCVAWGTLPKGAARKIRMGDE